MKYQEFKESTQIKFYDILKTLSHLNCGYLTYVLDHSQRPRILFFSNKDWLNTFFNHQLDKHCQITKFCKVMPKGLIDWSCIQPSDKNESRVLNSRKDHNIANGITIINQYKDMREIISLASTVDHVQFSKELLNNQNLLMHAIQNLRKVAFEDHIVLRF